jgi:hypothetical protein
MKQIINTNNSMILGDDFDFKKVKYFNSEKEAMSYLNRFIRYHNDKFYDWGICLRKIKISFRNLIDCNIYSDSYSIFRFCYETKDFWKTLNDNLETEKAIEEINGKFYITNFINWYQEKISQFQVIKIENKFRFKLSQGGTVNVNELEIK